MFMKNQYSAFLVVRRYIFCGAVCPSPGRYPASCPAEPGLSSPNSRIGEPKAAAWFIACSLYAKQNEKTICT